MSTADPAAPVHERSWVDRVLDITLFAPLGLAAKARAELPTLVAAGRERGESQLQLARDLARVAAHQGQQLVARLPGCQVLGRRGEQLATDRDEETGRDDVAPRAGVDAPLSGSAAADAPRAEDLAVDHYDSLAAAQIVDLLASLSPEERDAVERYELAHRNRRTIIGKIAQLRG